MRTITLEEHFLTESYVKATADLNVSVGMEIPEICDGFSTTQKANTLARLDLGNAAEKFWFASRRET